MNNLMYSSTSSPFDSIVDGLTQRLSRAADRVLNSTLVVRSDT
jgi:hypothetical protein